MTAPGRRIIDAVGHQADRAVRLASRSARAAGRQVTRIGGPRLHSRAVSLRARLKPGRQLPDWVRDSMSDEDFVDAAYRNVLHRPADLDGSSHWLGFCGPEDPGLHSSTASSNSPEAQSYPAIVAFHHTREQWMRSLPAARRILDLGGTATHDERGALLVMGYPHSFDDLAIVELPHDDRHELYQVPKFTALGTPQGRCATSTGR